MVMNPFDREDEIGHGRCDLRFAVPKPLAAPPPPQLGYYDKEKVANLRKALSSVLNIHSNQRQALIRELKPLLGNLNAVTSIASTPLAETCSGGAGGGCCTSTPTPPAPVPVAAPAGVGCFYGDEDDAF